MEDNYTIKEMVTKLYEKIEAMDDKIDSINTQTKLTNGTVKLHTKLIWGAYGFTFSLLISALFILL